MFAITLRPGNVDLSIAANMTLAGTVTMKLVVDSDSLLVLGFIVMLGCGVAVGCINYGLIRILRIPPIIATLSSGFIFQSTAIWYNRALRIKPPYVLFEFTTWKIACIPVLALSIMCLTVVMHILVTRTIYGRSVIAIGQNMQAARLARIATKSTSFLTYVMCAVFASICGFLLASFSGGVALNMGQEYLLASIAVVVIGGTSVAGGFANVTGLWGAALLLFLVVSVLNTYGPGTGIGMVLTGVIIIGVITAAGGKRIS